MSWIFGHFVRGRRAVGLLIVRLVFGVALAMHGWSKIQSAGGPFHWLPDTMHVPPVFQGLATLAEFGGGLALVVGLLTPLAALGIVCNMVVALALVHVPKGDPFVSSGGGGSMEPAVGYMAVALLMLFAGPGVISLDALWWPRTPWGRREDR